MDKVTGKRHQTSIQLDRQAYCSINTATRERLHLINSIEQYVRPFFGKNLL
jgi:hypothetical protein